MRFTCILGRFLGVAAAAVALAFTLAPAASAQLSIDPTSTPTLNNGGWVYGMAILLFGLGALVFVLIVVGYMRFAPRFTRADEGVVRAERIVPGREPPRRPVNITGAPIVVPAPVPVGAPAAAASPVPVAGKAASTAAPASAPVAGGTAGVAAAAAPVAAPTAPQQPSFTRAPAADGASPPAAAQTAPPAAEAPQAAAARERPEVSLDQETFDRVLAELLGKGTDRRVAEGQARRAALIAARKKAGG